MFTWWEKKKLPVSWPDQPLEADCLIRTWQLSTTEKTGPFLSGTLVKVKKGVHQRPEDALQPRVSEQEPQQQKMEQR